MKMGRIPNNISDVVLYKIVGDKDGGAFKLTTNPVNVEHPQSLRHVQPICEFIAPDSRENLATAMFNEGSPCKKETEDVIHRRCVLLHLKLGEQMEVFIVKNPYRHHNRKAPSSLPSGYLVWLHDECDEGGVTLEHRVAKVDFTQVGAILLMYRVKQCVDKIRFKDEINQTLAQLTLKIPLACDPHLTMQFTMIHYLLAGIFVGDLDFLAHFFGHHGVSAK